MLDLSSGEMVAIGAALIVMAALLAWGYVHSDPPPKRQIFGFALTLLASFLGVLGSLQATRFVNRMQERETFIALLQDAWCFANRGYGEAYSSFLNAGYGKTEIEKYTNLPTVDRVLSHPGFAKFGSDQGRIRIQQIREVIGAFEREAKIERRSELATMQVYREGKIDRKAETPPTHFHSSYAQLMLFLSRSLGVEILYQKGVVSLPDAQACILELLPDDAYTAKEPNEPPDWQCSLAYREFSADPERGRGCIAAVVAQGGAMEMEVVAPPSESATETK